jgi:hypothetical protein
MSVVGPTGLKPAPHGLKGRCSVTRAPDQEDGWLWRKDSNLRMAALTVRCLTSLATPQQEDGEKRRQRDGVDAETRGHGDVATVLLSVSLRLRVTPSPCLPVSRLEAMKGVEPLSFGLQDRRSVIQLSYIARGIADCHLPISN